MSSEDERLSEELARRLSKEESAPRSSEDVEETPIEEIARIIEESQYDADLAMALALQEEFNAEAEQPQERLGPFSIGGGGTEPHRSHLIAYGAEADAFIDGGSDASGSDGEIDREPRRVPTGAWAKRPNLPRKKPSDEELLDKERSEEALYQSLRGKVVARRSEVFQKKDQLADTDADTAALIHAILAAQEEGYNDEEIEEMLGDPDAIARAAQVDTEEQPDVDYDMLGMVDGGLSKFITKHDKRLTGRRIARNMERILGSSAGNLQDIEESTYFQDLQRSRQRGRPALAESYAVPHHATLSQSAISGVQRHLAKQTRKGQAARGRVEKELWATQGAVLDNRTRMILFKILSSGVLESVAGCLKEGKEAAIFLGLNWDHRLHVHIAKGGTATTFEDMYLQGGLGPHQASGEQDKDEEGTDMEDMYGNEPFESHEVRRAGQCMYCWPEFIVGGEDAPDAGENVKGVEGEESEKRKGAVSDVSAVAGTDANGESETTAPQLEKTSIRHDLHMKKDKVAAPEGRREEEAAMEGKDRIGADGGQDTQNKTQGATSSQRTLQNLEDRISDRDISKTVRFDSGVHVHPIHREATAAEDSEHPEQEDSNMDNVPRAGRNTNQEDFGPVSISASGHPKVVVAIKIYRTSRNRFKNRGEYIQTDRRYAFTTVAKQSSRDLINLWARKEYQNLVRVHRAGIPSPAPLLLNGHVLIMSLIGTEANPAPQLRNAGLTSTRQWSRAYLQVIMILYAMYQWCHLVHGDFTEFNILWYKRRAYVIDFGHAVDTSHALSDEFLEKDVKNITRFFKSKGAITLPEDMLFSLVKNSSLLPHPTSPSAFRTGSRLGRVPLSGSGMRRSKADILKESEAAPYDLELEADYKRILERKKRVKLEEEREEGLTSDEYEDTDDTYSEQSRGEEQSQLVDNTNIVLATSGGKIRFVPREQVETVDMDWEFSEEMENVDHFDGKTGPMARYTIRKFRELGLLA